MLDIIRRFLKKNSENVESNRDVENDMNVEDTSNGCNHRDFGLGDVTLSLTEKKQISFQLVECVKCGERRGIPRNNVNIAFERGTGETLNMLNKLGLDT